MAQVIQYRGTRADLRRAIRDIPLAITGQGPDPLNLREGVTSLMAFTFFSRVAANFDDLSKGGTGADGDKWPLNTPEYLAYQKGRFKGRRMAGSYRLGRENHLDADTKRVWSKANTAARKQVRADAEEAGVTLTDRQVKAKAAPIAWAATRDAGAESLIDHYPGQPDTILVDNGDLRRSIQPGVLSSFVYENADESQVFRREGTDAVVGTKDPKAAFHHSAEKLTHKQKDAEGAVMKGTVRRRLWPEVLPTPWVNEMKDELVAFFMRLPALIAGGRIR